MVFLGSGRTSSLYRTVFRRVRRSVLSVIGLISEPHDIPSMYPTPSLHPRCLRRSTLQLHTSPPFRSQSSKDLTRISLKDYETRTPKLVKQLLDKTANDTCFAHTHHVITPKE